MKNQSCYLCGCDTFRFKTARDQNPFLDNVCNNCDHRLRDHLKMSRQDV